MAAVALADLAACWGLYALRVGALTVVGCVLAAFVRRTILAKRGELDE